MSGHGGNSGADAERSSGSRPFSETKWSWIPVGALVMLAVSWGIVGLVEGGCQPGPRGGCVAADGFGWRGWVLFLAVMPSYVVVITGLTTDRWQPALGLALGGVAGGLYAIVQGRTAAHLITAGVLFALAVVSPALTWHRRRRGTPSPS
ncbi:hypothetical protein [Streptomyces sp. AK02-01A]|uniref:hypothetical protein n=1 Tax=Streptomyces sp. AK02-01A TaxID=3028648 RepID=UPI0029ABA365|nr:hypothetical protein [Streptomyces sp. AK02-01A]MDX3850307.1 hypothetical protein [Streptomyces sp. AK02-01A]